MNNEETKDLEQDVQQEQDAPEIEVVELEEAEEGGNLTPEEQLACNLKEAEDRNLRLMAEFDNFRRRAQKEKASLYPEAVADTVKSLLPVLDNFKRALETNCSDAEYIKGIQMTYQGFVDTLTKLGLEEFGAAGETFDANLHNAVSHIESDDFGANAVSQVFACGYKIGDRVIRYAMVQTAN